MKSGGFTTVELLVTLFVASLFVISGYQLYSVVNSRAANTRMMSEASNIGYEVLRKEGSVYNDSGIPACNTTVSTHPTQSVTRSDLRLPSPSIRIRRCVPFSGVPIILVTVTVSYDSPLKEVVHATYISEN